MFNSSFRRPCISSVLGHYNNDYNEFPLHRFIVLHEIFIINIFLFRLMINFFMFLSLPARCYAASCEIYELMLNCRAFRSHDRREKTSSDLIPNGFPMRSDELNRLKNLSSSWPSHSAPSRKHAKLVPTKQRLMTFCSQISLKTTQCKRLKKSRMKLITKIDLIYKTFPN